MKKLSDYFDCKECNGVGCDICAGTGKSNVSVHKIPKHTSVNSEWYQWYLDGMVNSFPPKQDER